MTKIAHGVASGMFYLHNRAILIHRDLAARNILLDENLKPLIADFGLCEFYCDEHYYFDEEVRTTLKTKDSNCIAHMDIFCIFCLGCRKSLPDPLDAP